MRFFLALLFLLPGVAGALEIEGILDQSCRRHTGIIIHVDDDTVEIMNLSGHWESVPRAKIDTVYVFNVIENPFAEFDIDANALARLKAVYLDNSRDPRALAFPVRFIEDLVIFYSLTGQTHVYTFADIYKLRPPPPSAAGPHQTHAFRAMTFALEDQSGQCGDHARSDAVRPTRVLADKIRISEYLHSFQQGYESVESFQERTYLYAKPFLFDKHSRLGLVFEGERDEPGLNLPLFFQWSTGEAYSFQSFNAIGLKRQEWVPNAEPVFSLRSDVKSHIFHGLFIGNVAGVAAGNSIFLQNSFLNPTGDLTVQPSFNYLAMMGADYGPYSLSVGFFYPTFAIKVKDQMREVLGSSVSYAVRAMYTLSHFRARVIGSYTDYSDGNASKSEVITQSGASGELGSPQSFTFNALFLRGGIDFDFSDQLSAGVDGIIVNGNYKEHSNDGSGTFYDDNIRFNRLTIQPYVRQSFGDYVSLSAYVDILQNNFKANFLNQDSSRQQQESRFFGTLEFIF